MTKEADRKPTLILNPPSSFGSLPEFLDHVSTRCADGDWVFRGQGNLDVPVPRAARGPVAKSEPEKLERRLLDEFYQKLPSVYGRNVSNDWEALALIQHYGGTTRLLDWTRNPLVALWFALNAYLSVLPKQRAKIRPCVWAAKVEVGDWVDIRSVEKSLVSIESVKFVSPPHFDARISAQESVFSVHPLPNSGLEAMTASSCWGHYGNNNIDPRDMPHFPLAVHNADDIYSKLRQCGYRADTVYPDMQGLCAHLSEEFRRSKKNEFIRYVVSVGLSN